MYLVRVPDNFYLKKLSQKINSQHKFILELLLLSTWGIAVNRNRFFIISYTKKIKDR